MALNINNSLDNSTIELHVECSMDHGHETNSDMDEDFEKVEMAFLGENSSNKSVDEARHTKAFSRNQWSAATLKVLSSMPSRSVEWSGAQQAQRSLRDCSEISEVSNKESHEELSHKVPQRKHLLRTLQALSADECGHTLRTMPLNLTEKRELKTLACRDQEGQFQSAKTPRICHFPGSLRKNLHSASQGVHYLLTCVQLWHGALKQVSGRFGTGVLSYFLFLRTLLLYNIFFSLIIIPFLVLPQVIQNKNHSPKQIRFTGLEILTGTGAFTNSLMFYGYYNNTGGETCTTSSKSLPCEAYNVRLAYLLTIAIGLFATCIMLVYSIFKTVGMNFNVYKSHGNLALKVFSSWDFKVSKMTSVQMQSENLCTQLKEMLSELHSGNPERSLRSRLIWLALHCTSWAICLTCIFFSVLGIYLFLQNRDQVRMSSAEDLNFLALPLLVCCLNHLLPIVFNMVAWMETYDSVNAFIYVAIVRNLILKVSSLCVICHHWLDKVAIQKKANLKPCWETFVGQELYRFLLMDLIFAMVFTIFGDFLWRVYTQGVLGRKRKPTFNIAQNVLELIFGQTLAWIGVLFIPLLPTVQILKLFLLFYLKRASLMINCQAPRKPWRATQMTTLFITFLFFPSFLGAATCITYTMWRLQPSSTCGPFISLSSMFSAGKELRRTVERSNPSLAWLSFIYSLLENSLFLFFITGLLLILVYIQIQVGDGQRRIIALLQKQIKNESEDKKFLIHKLQTLYDLQEV